MKAILIIITSHVQFAVISPLQIILLVLVTLFQVATVPLIIKALIICAINVLRIVHNAESMRIKVLNAYPVLVLIS
jgi:hypothetical protein